MITGERTVVEELVVEESVVELVVVVSLIVVEIAVEEVVVVVDANGSTVLVQAPRGSLAGAQTASSPEPQANRFAGSSLQYDPAGH